MEKNLDLGGKTIAWSEQEINKLIAEKKEYLKKKTKEAGEKDA